MAQRETVFSNLYAIIDSVYAKGHAKRRIARREQVLVQRCGGAREKVFYLFVSRFEKEKANRWGTTGPRTNSDLLLTLVAK